MVKKTAGWIHATLILAILLPLMCAAGRETGDMVEPLFYLRCLLIAFPVVATGIAVEKCRGAFAYFVSAVLVFAVTWGLGRWVAGSLKQDGELLMYLPILLAETLFVIVARFVGRMNKKREQDAAEARDPGWKPYMDILKTPSFLALIYFLIVYFLGLNMNGPEVCNEALFSAAVYGVAALLYHHVEETETYLSLNKRTCNLPSKRIYGIGNGMLALFLLLLAVAVLPAFFTISGRKYHDMRNGFENWNLDGAEFSFDMPLSDGGEIIQFSEMREPVPAPVWANVLFYLVGVGIFAVLTAVMAKKILDMLHDFRAAVDENGDVVEELKETEEEGMERMAARKGHRKLTERERIRKQYRKFIRRHRKERPAVYESPTEIEVQAGVVQSEEGKLLHGQYERARYGRWAE